MAFRQPHCHAKPWQLLVAAALGLATTIAVAWGCALWARFTQSYYPGVTPVPPGAHHVPPLPTDSVINGWATDEGVGVLLAEPMYRLEVSPGEWIDESRRWLRADGPQVRRMGWPMYALQSEVTRETVSWPGLPRRWQLPLGEILRRGPSGDELPKSLGVAGEPRLGLMPLPGLAVDALIYSVLWYALIAAWRRLRRSLAPATAPRRGFEVRRGVP